MVLPLISSFVTAEHMLTYYALQKPPFTHSSLIYINCTEVNHSRVSMCNSMIGCPSVIDHRWSGRLVGTVTADDDVLASGGLTGTGV